MATHNQVLLAGYVKSEPKIQTDSSGAKSIMIKLTTVRREMKEYIDSLFLDVIIRYDGSNDQLINRMEATKKNDLIIVKGVFNIVVVNKVFKCPECNSNVIQENAFMCTVYPQFIQRITNLNQYIEKTNDPDYPNKIIQDNVSEISNHILMVGSLVKEPEMIEHPSKKIKCCRYPVAINRKYYIATQSDTTADYPWVYSYGKQAENDLRYLKQGSDIMIDGFIRVRRVKKNLVCTSCNKSFTAPTLASELVPYAVEYFNNYLSEEEAQQLQQERLLKERAEAEKKIKG